MCRSGNRHNIGNDVGVNTKKGANLLTPFSVIFITGYFLSWL